MIIYICAEKTQKFASLLIHDGNYQNNDIQALSFYHKNRINLLSNMIVQNNSSASTWIINTKTVENY